MATIDAHLRPARADRVDEIPELTARERIDAGRRLVEDEKVGIVDERAAEAQLLLHAAGKLAGRTRLELLHRRGGQQFGDARAALLRALTEQATEEVDVLEHAERWVEVASEALRHIGNAAANLAQGFLVGEVLVEDDDLAVLDLAHARDERQQSRLSDAVRPDHADHDARRNVDADVVERDSRPVGVRYVR